MVEKTVIFSSGKYEIYLEKGNGYISLVSVYYPIYPYGNNVWQAVGLNTVKKSIHYCSGSENWGGTGSSCTDDIELTENEFNDIYNAMMNVKTLDDFDELAEKVNELIKTREDIAEELFNKVVEKAEELASVSEEIEVLRWLLTDEEELREKIEEYFKEHVTDELKKVFSEVIDKMMELMKTNERYKELINMLDERELKREVREFVEHLIYEVYLS
ncbi:MAG: hypothetical protein QXL19_10380 [Ignisphaera sp.]